MSVACQRLLTHAKLGSRGLGGLLDCLEGFVDLERLGEVLGASGSDVVGGDAANGKGATCQRLLTLYLIRKVWAGGGVLDARQGAVDSERLCEDLGTLRS